MPPPQSPVLGSLAVQAPSLTPQIVHVSPSTCNNLSLFKDLLREYRKLDDSITMRLNRANAQVRDQGRQVAIKGNTQDQACAYLWQELVANWKRRRELVEYCVAVVDSSIDSKEKLLFEDKQADAAAQRKIQAELYSEQVRRNQVHNELTVESIVRRRSLDAFRSRCKYFVPPLNDAEARRMWDSAQ